ncbi:MAG: ABC transporter permease [Candidatus Tectimicrobiota bacterium]
MALSLPSTVTFRPVEAWSQCLALLKRAPRVSLVIVLLSVVVAVLAPQLAPHSPIDADLRARARPPVFLDGGSMTYLLGTDRQGRDILSRVIVGTRLSLSVAVLSILVGGTCGTALGLLAGYRGGWVDAAIMRTVDLTLAFPSILLALIFAVTIGASFWVVVLVLAFILWARYARLVRGEVLAWKQRDFVALARMAGCSGYRIIVTHLLPNVVNSVVVLSTLQVGWAIVVEASLSFLGAGIPAPAPTWGGMVAEGRKYVETLWWVSVFPGIAIMLVVLSFNLFGDWLRDMLDPKLRQL